MTKVYSGFQTGNLDLAHSYLRQKPLRILIKRMASKFLLAVSAKINHGYLNQKFLIRENYFVKFCNFFCS